MTRKDRAKQFMPFDAMKGLQEALRDREERHSRVARHDISEEQQMQNSEVIMQLEKRSRVIPVDVTVAHGDAFVSSISKRIRFASSAKRKAG